jgi:PAS domain-containing protein
MSHSSRSWLVWCVLSCRVLAGWQRSVAQYWEHQFFREMYSQSSDAMFILDLDGTIHDCNGAALHLFKVLNARGRPSGLAGRGEGGGRRQKSMMTLIRWWDQDWVAVTPHAHR